MSDTPRTDAEMFIVEWPPAAECVVASFARKLERELVESRKSEMYFREREQENTRELSRQVREQRLLLARAIGFIKGELYRQHCEPPFTPHQGDVELHNAICDALARRGDD